MRDRINEAGGEGDNHERGYSRGLRDPLRPSFAPLAGKLIGVLEALLREHFVHPPPALHIPHDYEIPWLREADAGRVMGRGQDAGERLVGYRLVGELTNVPATGLVGSV